MIRNSYQIISTTYKMLFLVGLGRTLTIISTSLAAKHKELVNHRREELDYQKWQRQSLNEVKQLLSKPPVAPL